mgnify:CR=1 FL=1
MYFEASQGQPGFKAQIESLSHKGTVHGWYRIQHGLQDRCIPNSLSVTGNAGNPECLSFWYHMYGTQMGTLTSSIRNSTGLNQIFTSTGINQDLWLYFSATVESGTDWTIVFTGKQPLSA